MCFADLIALLPMLCEVICCIRAVKLYWSPPNRRFYCFECFRLSNKLHYTQVIQYFGWELLQIKQITPKEMVIISNVYFCVLDSCKNAVWPMPFVWH